MRRGSRWTAQLIWLGAATVAAGGCGGSPTPPKVAQFAALSTSICREAESFGLHQGLKEKLARLKTLVRADESLLRAHTCLSSVRGAAPVEHHPAVSHVAENVPRLTRSQISTARRIVRNDRSVARLFHGVTYHVAHLGPWSTGGEQNRLIGVIFFINLDRPANVTGIWPTATYEPQRPFPSYGERYEYLRTTGLSAVEISVDLAGRKVAGVSPG
jgi:hypothetical protein